MLRPDGPAMMLVKDTRAIVSLPEICLRLREVLGDPDHIRKDVAEIILHDPGLSARLLRIVNSAYYGLPSAVRDISQALGIIGEYELNNLATVTAIIRNMSALNPGFDLRAFWKGSIFAATLAANLGGCCKGTSREELFLGGLLLDVGRLLLYIREPEFSRCVQQRIAQSGRPAWQIEQDLLGYDHCEVGAALARAWNFSELLQQGIASHHRLQPGDSNGEVPALMFIVSHYADQIDPGAAMDETGIAHLAPSGLEHMLAMDKQELASVLAVSVDACRHTFDAFFGGHA